MDRLPQQDSVFSSRPGSAFPKSRIFRSLCRVAGLLLLVLSLFAPVEDAHAYLYGAAYYNPSVYGQWPTPYEACQRINGGTVVAVTPHLNSSGGWAGPDAFGPTHFSCHSRRPQDNWITLYRTGTACPNGGYYDWTTGECGCNPTKNHCQCSASSYGNPINCASGNKTQRETDYVGSKESGLMFERYYNGGGGSVASYTASNWNHTYNRGIVPVTSSSALAIRHDGKSHFFALKSGLWKTDADVTDKLEKLSTGWRYTLRDGSVEMYNTAGRFLSITDRAGRVQTILYDGSGKRIGVHGPFGQSLTFGYDSSNRLNKFTDPAGNVTSYTYDMYGNPVKVTGPDGKFRIYHYENTTFVRHLTGITDENGVRFATYNYDDKGRAISTEHAGGMERFNLSYISPTQSTATDAVGIQEMLTFSAQLGVKNLISKTNLFDGKTLTQTFDTNNNLICKTDEEGRVTTWTYNATNQKTSETTGLTGTCAAPVNAGAARNTTYQYLSATLDLPTQTRNPSVYAGQMKTVAIGYDATRNPVSITQSGFTPAGSPVSRGTSMQYNALGQVISIDGPRTDLADVTTLDYYACTTGGACGQLISIANTLGQVTRFDSYDPNGRLTQQTDPNGLTTTYVYDARGRVTAMGQTPPGGATRVTGYTYDGAGQFTSVQTPDGKTLAYTYDAAHKLARVTDNHGNHVDYSYDLKGNRVSEAVYDPGNTLVKSVQSSFDIRNRLSAVNNGGSLSQYLNDAVGNVAQTVTPNGYASVNGYDALNRLLQTVDALSGVTSYGYDTQDRLALVQAPNNATTQYVYDDLGNLLQELSPDRGTTTYSYDSAGNRISHTDARGITAIYSYDALNRPTSIDYPGSSEDVTLVYDNCVGGAGRLCQAQDASGLTQYAYDAFGNVSTQTVTAGGTSYTTVYAYDSANRITAIAYPNGRQVHYTRDILGRIQSVSTTANGVATVLSSNRSYRADGLLAMQSMGNGLTDIRQYDLQGRLTYQSLGSADTRLYGYDLNGNLLGAQSLTGVGAYTYDGLDRLNADTWANTALGYGYDGNGNRTALNGSPYSYPAGSNRLTSSTSESFSYDAAGNLIGRQPLTLAYPNRSTAYAYDGPGRLKEIAQHACSPLFGCVDMTVATYTYDYRHLRTRKDLGIAGTTVYHYDLQGRLILETDAAGNAGVAYVWDDIAPIAQLTGTTISYLHTDHLHTPRLATDASQAVVWRNEGTAFGNPVAGPVSSNPTPAVSVNLRFPGQYYDAESGLHYNWNRYYDPRSGRYITTDPIGLDGGLNTYAYARNNPARFVDPFGLKGCGAGFFEPIIPNNPLGFAFEGCCDGHDDCYDDCKTVPLKSECDNSFCNCASNKCNKYSGTVFLTCKKIAAVYCDKVSNTERSRKSFDDSRKKCPVCTPPSTWRGR